MDSVPVNDMQTPSPPLTSKNVAQYSEKNEK